MRGTATSYDPYGHKRSAVSICWSRCTLGCDGVQVSTPRSRDEADSALSAILYFYSQPFLIITSAICRVLSAAPLRIWSPTTHRLKVLGLDSSRRKRPTKQSYFSEV